MSDWSPPSSITDLTEDLSDTVHTDTTDSPWSSFPEDDPTFTFESHRPQFGSGGHTRRDGGAPSQDLLLWFPDGNIVFLAGNTSFKVHAGVVQRQQKAFLRDQSFLLNISDRDPIEGCPVVLVEDSAHDFRHLLRVIYDGPDYFQSYRAATFSDLASAARLAHKYHMLDILEEARKRMTPLFPTASEAWNANTSLRATMLEANDPIEAVNLFRALQWDNMLPSALYLACQLPARMLLLGAPRADGTLEKLTAADVARCVTLHRACVEASVTAHDAVFPVEGKNRCGGWFRWCHMRMAKEGLSVRDKALHGDPLGETLRVELERIVGSSGGKICATCLQAASQTERSQREEFWCSLQARVVE